MRQVRLLGIPSPAGLPSLRVRGLRQGVPDQGARATARFCDWACYRKSKERPPRRLTCPQCGRERLLPAYVNHPRHSDTLLIFLLKGARPQKYKDRSHQEHTGRVELTARPFKDVSDDDLETMLAAAKAFKAQREAENT
jgi:hypothetical protein